MGSLEWTSPFFRIFCSLALLSITLIALSFIQFLIWNAFPTVVYYLCFFEAGMIGNGIDRLRLGAVRDFISIPFFGHHWVINFADICEWIGAGLLLVAIWSHPERFWRKEEFRKNFLIFPRSQIKLVSVLLLVTTIVAGSSLLLVSAYFSVNAISVNLTEITLCFGIFFLLMSLVVMIFGVLWSQRVYGPFKAIERFIKSGNNKASLRLTDENEVIEEVLKTLKP